MIPRDSLRSPIADELRWYFRWSAADLGFRAQSYGGSGGIAYDRNPDRMTDHQLAAVAKHRRISEGLAKLSREKLAVLRAGFAPRRQLAQIEAALGELQELALATKAARKGHERDGKGTLEGWLADKCGRRDPVVSVIREQAEAMLADAVLAYKAVRVAPKRGVREPEDVTKIRRPRTPIGRLLGL